MHNTKKKHSNNFDENNYSQLLLMHLKIGVIKMNIFNWIAALKVTKPCIKFKVCTYHKTFFLSFVNSSDEMFHTITL